MKKFVVHACVSVPIWGHIAVEADSPEEARKKALETVEGCDDGDWGSNIWNHGEWMEDIRWEAAEDFAIEDVVEVTV